MIKKIGRFIHDLRIILFVFILISFLTYLGLNPVNLGKFIGAKMGSAIGMSVSIPENPFNKLAVQLKEKEDRLNQKEIELQKLEADLKRIDNSDFNFVNIFLALGIFGLFVLILINFYLDYRRRKYILSKKD